MENELPKYSSLESVLSFFQTRPDVGGFVVQKNEEHIEFDAYFSDEFLGQKDTEAYSTMIIVIAAMRSMADDLTKRLATSYGVKEDQIRQDVAETYYQIKKDKDAKNASKNNPNN